MNLNKIRKSEKILRWTPHDVVMNVLVYFFNFLILAGMFFIFLHLKGEGLVELIVNLRVSVHFASFLAAIIILLFIYFFFEDKNFLKNSANSEMIFFVLEVSLFICYAIGHYVNMFIRPFALPALLIMFLANRRSAVFVNIIFTIIVFLMDVFSGQVWIITYTSLFNCFASGLVATFCVNKDCSRIKLLSVSWVISLPAVLGVFLILLGAGFTGALHLLVLSACSGPFAVMDFIILLPILEFLFQRVSCFKLAELTDHKSKLIRRLIAEAPGTFNHSIVVSNIAEACATAIGEDALFARTCAYYHDIGKLRRPDFFSENIMDGNSPHDELMPELSANIIRSHVQDGYELVRKSGMSRSIANICLEHHGTMPILFFYGKAKKYTDGEVDIKDYCYHGPKPQSKIAAILMIADGCEAASRSLKNRSRENVTAIVRKIVNDRMELGQFDECEITIKELNIIIHTVVNNLTGIYHKRVEYPKISLNGLNLNKDTGKEE